ncbi:MAG: hypothetical protein Q9213_002829 [Squamulea squamosa]
MPKRRVYQAERKASEPLDDLAAIKRMKNSHAASPEEEKKPINVVPFPEKPAVIEERNGEIEFRVVNNDNTRDSLIILTGLKCIFQKQLPKMPKDYIARLVYDRTHLSMAIIKKPLEVVGGITYRPFNGRQFAEIVFCAISSDQQVKGYGAHLMSHLKDYVKATSPIQHFLTYADNYAIGYFKKQGFTKEITLEKPRWMGYIKDYEGGTIMQCTMVPKIRYLEAGRMLLKQKEAVLAKIRAFSKSHIVHPPPKDWRNGVCQIDPMDVPAIKASGWSPDMDELARQPRHGPNYNQLLHLLNDMQNHSSSWPFVQPVNRDEVADYYEVIKEPMDFSTMEEKHEKDLYPTPEDFIHDAKLIFDNCRKYNLESSPYVKSANKLEKYMYQQIKLIPEWSGLEDLTVTTLPDPIPSPDTYLIAIHATATNFFDLLQIRGKYQHQPPLPWISGAEFAGVVISAPASKAVPKFRKGDRVFGSSQGGYATRICAREESLMPVPPGWGFLEAAGLMVTAPTSYAALVNRANIKRGDYVLVHAAAGGVGLAAVQIAKAFCATVIATAGSRRKLEISMGFGADHAIDYNKEGWAEEVKKLTPKGRGVDVVFDPVGMVNASLKCTAWGGRIVIIGFTSGNIEKVAMNKVLLKNISLVGLHWGTYARESPETVEEVWEGLFRLMKEGTFRGTVYTDREFRGLEQVGEALGMLGRRETWGKVVVSVHQDSESKL